MKKLRNWLLPKILNSTTLCFSPCETIVRGNANDLMPVIIEGITQNPKIEKLLVNSVAEYLRLHPNERNDFARKIYTNQ